MMIVFLKFGPNRDAAKDHMADHKAWLQQGFDDGAFLVAGSLQPGLGGGIIAIGARAGIEERISRDPFVIEQVAIPEFHEITPAMTTQALAFLKEA